MGRYYTRSLQERIKDAKAEERVKLMLGREQYGPRYLDTIYADPTTDRATLADYARRIYGTGVLHRVAPDTWVVLSPAPLSGGAPQGGRDEATARRGNPTLGGMATGNGKGLDTTLPHFGHPA